MGLAPVAGLVLQIIDRPVVAPTKSGYDQIQLAAATEISSLHIRDATDAVQQRVRLKAPIAQATQPDHTAARSIGRLHAAQIGDQNVLDAVAVEIDNLRVSGVEALVRPRAV